MDSNDGGGDRDRWARLRFAVVGPLLASPPPAGQLRAELERLSQRDWDHPSGKGPVRFAVSTIERWYYQARSADQDPVKALRRRPRADAGRARAMSPALIQALRDQHRAHPSWSAQLHHENLGVLVEADPALYSATIWKRAARHQDEIPGGSGEGMIPPGEGDCKPFLVLIVAARQSFQTAGREAARDGDPRGP